MDIKDMVNRENNIYKTAHALGFKEGYKKGILDGQLGGLTKGRKIFDEVMKKFKTGR